MTSDKIIVKAANGLHGEIVIPGDKSVSHRSIMLSSIGRGTVKIHNFLSAQDCLSTLKGMQRMGVKIDVLSDTEIVVQGVGMHGLQEPENYIDAGDSGTMLRLLLGLLAPQKFMTTFIGDDLLTKRPMARVIKPLTQMGGKFLGRLNNSRLPITIIPTDEKLKAITYNMPVASAQVKSAVLLAGLYAEGKTSVVEPVRSRDHTERMLRAFGVTVIEDGLTVTVEPPMDLTSPEEIYVPGDISSAAFWLVAGSIIPGSDITLRGVGINRTRTGIVDVLKEMGANIEVFNKTQSGGEEIADLRVQTAVLKSVNIGADIMPRLVDEIPVIAVAAMFAEGKTVITGAQELRVKETDRLHAVAVEFKKLGADITELEDGLIIDGGKSLNTATCFSYDDHRIAMALAIAGIAGNGVKIEAPKCVDISYPAFYQTLADLQK